VKRFRDKSSSRKIASKRHPNYCNKNKIQNNENQLPKKQAIQTFVLEIQNSDAVFP
jgi:hypothetical protein